MHSEEAFVDRVLGDVPELRDPATSDFGRVCLLRSWATARTPVCMLSAEPLDVDPAFRFYGRPAHEIYSAFERRVGAVRCGGAAYALARLYGQFGYEAYAVTCGFPGTRVTHVVTLVRIAHEGRAVLSLQDALFDMTLLAADGGPADYLEWLRGAPGRLEAPPEDSERLLLDEGRFRRERWGLRRFENEVGHVVVDELVARGHPGDFASLLRILVGCWAPTEGAARALQAQLRVPAYFDRPFPRAEAPRPAPKIDLRAAVERRRDELAQVRGRLSELRDLVDSPRDLSMADALLLYALALEVRPSLVVEIGRGRGNSTCVFTEYANRADARVVSVCRSDAWRTHTAPRVGAAWLARLDAREAEVAAVDFEALLGEHRGVLFLWDAHGADLAELVIARAFPALARRGATVVVHDVTDARSPEPPRAEFRDAEGNRSLWLPPFKSIFPELLFVVDFLARNGIAAQAAAEAANALPDLGLGDAAGGGFIHFALEPDAAYVFPEYRRPDLEAALRPRPPAERLEVKVGADDWPVAFRRNDGPRTPLGRELLRCAVDARRQLEVVRHGASGGLVLGRYASGHADDHCATPFCDGAAGPVFFSVWTRGAAPRVVLQDDQYVDLSRGRAVLQREDGWSLVAGVGPGAGRLRVVLQLGPGEEAELRNFLIAAT